MTRIDGLQGLADRLARLDLATTEAAALEQAAIMLQGAVWRRLSLTPGESHDAPWLRRGTLRDSIGCVLDGTEAVVGSTDPVATDQECGTHTDPPRPFLAPAAAAEADALVADIATAVLSQLRAVLT